VALIEGKRRATRATGQRLARLLEVRCRLRERPNYVVVEATMRRLRKKNITRVMSSRRSDVRAMFVGKGS